MQNGMALNSSEEMAVIEAPVYTRSTTGEPEPIENPIPSSSWSLLTDQGRYEPLAPTDARPVGECKRRFRGSTPDSVHGMTDSSPDVAVDGSIKSDSELEDSTRSHPGLLSRILNWFR